MRKSKVIASTVNAFMEGEFKRASIRKVMPVFSTANTSWLTLARFTEMSYAKACKANTGFRNERKDGVSTIKKVNELRQRLTREFNTNDTRWKVFELVFNFNCTI